MDMVMIFKSSRVICCHNDLDGYFDEDGDNISPQVDLMEGLQLDRDPWGRRRSSRWQIFFILFVLQSLVYNLPFNKTQCQLCKRLAGPIIPLSWSCLVCKTVSHMDVITGGQKPFS